MADLGSIGIGSWPYVASAPAQASLIGFARDELASRNYDDTAPRHHSGQAGFYIASAPSRPDIIGRDQFIGNRQLFDLGPSRRGSQFYVGSGRRPDVGNPVGSMAVAAGGVWRCRLPIVIGTRQISVQVQHSHIGPLWRAVVFKVLPNVEVGLAAPLTASSTETLAWQTLGPLGWTSPAQGGVEIEIKNPGHDPALVFIDNLILL